MYQLLIKDRNNLYQNVEIQEEGGLKISANEPFEFKFGRSIKTYTIKIMNNGHNNIVFDNIFYKNFDYKRVWNAKLKINEIYFEGLFKISTVNEFELSGQFISGAGLLWEQFGDTKLPDLMADGSSVWSYLNHTKTIQLVNQPADFMNSHGFIYDNDYRGLTKGETKKGMIFPWGEVVFAGTTKTPIEHWKDYFDMIPNTRRNFPKRWGDQLLSTHLSEMNYTDLSTRNIKFRLKDFLEKGIFNGFEVEQKIWEDNDIYESIYLDTNNLRRRFTEQNEDKCDFELENSEDEKFFWEDIVGNNKFNWEFTGPFGDDNTYKLWQSIPFLGEEIEDYKRLEWDETDKCYYLEATEDMPIDIGFNLRLRDLKDGPEYDVTASSMNLIIEHIDSDNNVINTIFDKTSTEFNVEFVHTTFLFLLREGEKIKFKMDIEFNVLSSDEITEYTIDYTFEQTEFIYRILPPWLTSEVEKTPEFAFHIQTQPDVFVIGEELEGKDLVPNIRVRDFINEFLRLFNIEFHFNFETKKLLLLNRQQSKDTIETFDFTTNILEDTISLELQEPTNFVLKYEKEDMFDGLSEYFKNLVVNNLDFGHKQTEEISYKFGYPYFKRYIWGTGDERIVNLGIYQNNNTEEHYYANESDIELVETSKYTTEYNPRLSFYLYNSNTDPGDIGKFVSRLGTVDPLDIAMFSEFLADNYFDIENQKFDLSFQDFPLTINKTIETQNFEETIEYYNKSKRINFQAKIDHTLLNNIYYMLGKDLTAYYYIGVDGYKGYYQITELDQINDDFYRVKAFEVIPQNAGELPPQPPGDYNCDFNNDFDNVGCEGLWYKLETDSNQAGAQTFGDGFYKVDDEVEVYTTGTFVLIPGIEVNFLHWKDELDNIVSEQPEFIYTMPALNKTLTAVYETIELPKLTIKSQNGGKVNYEIARPTGGELGATELGTVNPGEEKEWTNVPAGTTVKVTAVPNFGFEFTKFYKYILMTELVYENPHEFTLTGDDTLIEARFNLLIEGQQ